MAHRPKGIAQAVFIFSPVKHFVARSKSQKSPRDKSGLQKSARETQMLPVAKQQIKKFHGQQKVSRGKK